MCFLAVLLWLEGTINKSVFVSSLYQLISLIPQRTFKFIFKIKELPQSIPLEVVFQLKESENLVFVILS